jgi:hypothetical protein
VLRPCVASSRMRLFSWHVRHYRKSSWPVPYYGAVRRWRHG